MPRRHQHSLTAVLLTGGVALALASDVIFLVTQTCAFSVSVFLIVVIQKSAQDTAALSCAASLPAQWGKQCPAPSCSSQGSPVEMLGAASH